MVFLNFTQLLYAFLVDSKTKWPSILNDNAKPLTSLVRLKITTHGSSRTFKSCDVSMFDWRWTRSQTLQWEYMHPCSVRMCVRVCVCVCARACVRARVRVPVIDYWNGPLASILFYIFIYAQGKMDTETNFVICLGVRFALHVIKALRLASIEHCSRTVVTRFFFLHTLIFFFFWLRYAYKYRLCRMSSLPFIMHILFIVWHTHTHMRARMHAHTHTHTHTRRTRKHVCLWLATGNSLPSAEALALTSSTKCWRVNVVKHQGTRSYAGNIIPLSGEEPLAIKKILFFFFLLSVDWTKKKLARRRMANIFFWKLTCYDADSDFTLVRSKHLKERRQVIFVSHRKKGRCAGPDHFPLHKAAREGSVIESNMSCLRLAELLQHLNRRLCSSWTALELFARNFERTHGRAITKIRQQRTRTDPHRGCRVECTSCEHQASQCSSTAINEQEKLERKRALCLKREEGKRTGLWSTFTRWPPKVKNAQVQQWSRAMLAELSPREMRPAIGNQAMT